MKKKLPKSGEIYAYYIEELEKYGAFQILKVEGNSVCYVSLDCLTDHLPQKEEVLDWKPLYWESYRNHHKMDTGIIELTPLPPSYQCLGEFPLVTEKISDAFFGRWPDASDYVSEIRWKSFDEKVTAAYKKYINSSEDVVIHGKIFPKRLDVLRDDLYRHLNEQDSLEQFPCINVARVEGFSQKLLKLIKTASLLTKLELKSETVNRQEILHIVQAYTEQFNLLNEKYKEFIETEEREDIFAAMKQLYEVCLLKRFTEGDIVSENSLDITLEEIYDAMDEVRGDW